MVLNDNIRYRALWELVAGQKWWLLVKILERLRYKANLVMLLVERVEAVIPSNANLASVECITQ